MYRVLFLPIILASCTAKELKITEDFIEGEIETAEKIMQDLSATDPLQGKKKPKVEISVPVKKF
jgi:hypothetical protein